MTDPAKLADIIGADGFTIVLVRNIASESRINSSHDCARCLQRVVGRLPVKARTIHTRNGARTGVAVNGKKSSWKKIEKDAVVQRPSSAEQKKWKLEVAAFAMSPHYQAAGSGAQVLSEIKRSVTRDANGAARLQNIVAKNAAFILDLALSNSGTTIPLHGINLVRQKDIMTAVQARTPKEKIHDPAKSKLMLMDIREPGNETCY